MITKQRSGFKMNKDQFIFPADLARKTTQEANLPCSAYMVSEVNKILSQIRIRAEQGENGIYLPFHVKDVVKSRLRELGYVVSDEKSQATIISWV